MRSTSSLPSHSGDRNSTTIGQITESLARLRELLAVVVLRREPLRILQQHRAELPGVAHGFIASPNRYHTASSASSGRCFGYTLALPAASGSIASRMSVHNVSGLVGCPVISEYAFTFMRNPSGLRSAHPPVSSGDGGR